MRRVIFYLFYDATGQVDDFVQYKLRALRHHAEHIFVVSNSPLNETNRRRLEEVADTVWQRENVGYDVYAYREAMAQFGHDRLAGYDELILMNCTFFGPIGSFDPLFATMDADQGIDFWGVSEHGAMEPHPFMPADRMEAHIQSHWIGVRSAMFSSTAWEAYWSAMPEITSYHDSVNLHEGRFTHYFAEAGFRARVAFPAADFPSAHPIIDNAEDVLAAGCPIIKRRSFFSDPLYLDRRAVDTRALAGRVKHLGYPVEMMYANLARTSEPRVLATNLGLLEVLPDADLGDAEQSAPLVVALVHADVPDLLPGILDHVDHLPAGHRLVVTVPSREVEAAVAATLEARGRGDAEIRLVDPRGEDVSALLVGCRDLIESDQVDLIVRLRTMARRRADDPKRAELFERHLLQNLLASPGYTANVLRLFQQHSSLGLVMAPAMHIGFPTLGHGWSRVAAPAKREGKRLGIAVPFDTATPLAPYGRMFVARPAALRRFVQRPYDAADFDDQAKPSGAVRIRVLERLLAYAALDEGFHVREVMHPDLAAVNYFHLEYKYQSLVRHLPPRPENQLRYLGKLKAAAALGRRRWPARTRAAMKRARLRMLGKDSAPEVRPRATPAPGAVGGISDDLDETLPATRQV